MILCCPTCGCSFPSNIAEKACPYCMGDTEILLTAEEVSNITADEIMQIANAVKQKYKSSSNPRYNQELWTIREQRDQKTSMPSQPKEPSASVTSYKITTGYNFEGYIIRNYIHVVSGSAVLGTGVFTEVTASFSDLLGTTSAKFENKIEQAKTLALDKMIQKSIELGGNALIGVDFDFFTLSNNMIAVSANGTVVSIEPMEIQ